MQSRSSASTQQTSTRSISTAAAFAFSGGLTASPLAGDRCSPRALLRCSPWGTRTPPTKEKRRRREVTLRPVLHLLGSADVEGTAHLRIVQPLAEGLEERGYATQVW